MTVGALGGIPLIMEDGHGDGLHLSTLERWYDRPAIASEVVEHGVGDGGFKIADDLIRYPTRVIHGEGWWQGDNRLAAVQAGEKLAALLHEHVRLQVTDDTQDSYAEGLLDLTLPTQFEEHWFEWSFDLTCEDPRRYSPTLQKEIMLPASTDGDGGLSFGDDGAGLVFPLDFGVTSPVQNACTLINRGNATAYPVLQVFGPLAGLEITWAGNTLGFSRPVGTAGLTLDSLTHTAKVGVLDQSQFLTEREFPTIEPGSTVTLAMVSSGPGWVTATVRDTWM